MIFDWFMGVLVMCFAFTQGVFPKPPDFSKLPAFDISFFASNMRFTLFLLTVLGVGFLVAFALLSARVKAFWERVRQGFTILRDCRRYRRDMASWQFASWVGAVRRRTGRCSTRSTSGGRSGTRCWCSVSRWSRRCSRSPRAAPACSRRCC